MGGIARRPSFCRAVSVHIADRRSSPALLDFSTLAMRAINSEFRMLPTARGWSDRRRSSVSAAAAICLARSTSTSASVRHALFCSPKFLSHFESRPSAPCCAAKQTRVASSTKFLTCKIRTTFRLRFSPNRRSAMIASTPVAISPCDAIPTRMPRSRVNSFQKAWVRYRETERISLRFGRVLASPCHRSVDLPPMAQGQNARLIGRRGVQCAKHAF